MATSLRITSRKVRGVGMFTIDLRSVGMGREFFREKRAAELRLIEIQNQGLAAASLTPAERHEFIQAKRVLSDLGATSRQAVEFFAAHHSGLEKKRLAEAISLFIAAKIEKQRRAKYTDALRYDLGSFLAFCGDMLCHEIGESRIEGWLRSNKWAPKTKNGKLISMNTFFSFCLKRGWVTKIPSRNIEWASLDHKTPGILSVQQCERLMCAVQNSPNTVPYFTLALFGGVRPEELSRLKATHIDVNAGLVRIDGEVAKTHARRVVHLSENAVAWLRFCGHAKTAVPAAEFDSVRALAGFSVPNSGHRKAKSKTHGEPWPHDCLRHSFVSYSLPIHGVSHTAREAGHSESILHRNYKDLVAKEDAVKFWGILPV